MKTTAKFVTSFLLAVMTGGGVKAVEVTVSIKPIHSLVAGVMGMTGEPRLLLTGAASPHSYQMRPSDAVALSEADLIVWVGENLETFLVRSITNLGASAHILTLKDTSGIHLLAAREGGIQPEAHDADKAAHNGSADARDRDVHHDHDPHEERGHDKNDHNHGHGAEYGEAGELHDHDKHAETHEAYDHGAHEDDHEEHGHGPGEGGHVYADSDHDGDHGHDHGEFDMHIWLSPANAAVMVDVIAAELAEIDPANAAAYQENAHRMRDRIAATEEELAQTLLPFKDHGFIVFHDAYQYFDRAFGLNHVGTIAIDPARPAGARRLTEIRAALIEHDVKCVFSEPQFKPSLVQTVTEGTIVKSSSLDPLGAGVEASEDAWFQIIKNLGNSFTGCLSD